MMITFVGLVLFVTVSVVMPFVDSMMGSLIVVVEIDEDVEDDLVKDPVEVTTTDDVDVCIDVLDVVLDILLVETCSACMQI
jgi:hypothetical protein